jgi:D-amino-acid dehydrogenase
MRSIAVIGAGITGVTAAYNLLDKGYAVTVFDRHRYPAMDTSFANGGQLSASNAEVWNNWSTILHGLQWLFRKDAPLLMRLRPDWHKASWIAEFMAAIRNYEANTVATAKLAVAAREHMFAIAEREQIRFDLEKRGILHVYRNRASYDHAMKVNALLAQGGLERRAVTPQEIAQIEPSLAGDWYGGFFTPSDSTGDIHKFTCGLADACVRRGATLHLDTDVTAVAATDGRIDVDWAPRCAAKGEGERTTFDAVVVSAGVASRRFARMLGDRVNVYPVKGYSITVALDDPASREAAPWVSLLDDDAKIVSSRLGPDRLRVAGTAEFAGENRDIVESRIRPLVKWTRKLFPAVNTEAVTPWAGLRPMMPNMMPYVGPGRRPGVFYHTGHGHLGWTLSAATAHSLATIVDARLAA